MNKKVAFFLPPLGDGGVERTVLRLAGTLVERGYKVDVVTVKAQGPFLQKIHGDVEVIDLNTRRALTSLPGLANYLRREQPKALISAQYYTNVVAIWARAMARVSTRLVVTERLAASMALTDSHKVKDKLLPTLMRWSYPKANAIVAVSKGAAEDLARMLRLPSDRIQVIYNPTFDETILEQASEPVEHPWFGDNQPPIILGAGRMTYQKDFSTLLRAFALVRKELEARLIILGEGEGRPRLEKLAEELGVAGDVVMPGFVGNPYKYMVNADLFVLSSRYEGMPNVLVEALAVGTPAIATDCPSGPREVLPEEALVPVGQSRKMAEKIKNLFKNEKLADRLLKKVQKKLDLFQLDKCVQQYMELIEGNE